MTKIKITIVAATALCVFAAIASPAFATFKSASSPIKVLAKSTQPQIFTASNTEVKCTNAMFFSTGQTTSTSSSQLKMTAIYVECTTKINGGGETSATVNMESCSYNFHSGTSEPTKGSTTVECPTGRSIKIAASGCELEVPAAGNANLKAVEFANEPAGKVKVTPAVTGITAKVVSGFFKEAACSIGGIESNKEGQYKGAAEAEGKTSGGTGVNIEVA